MKNEITTIQIRSNVKNELDRFREKSNESYEDVIVKLVDGFDKRKREEDALLIEGCKVMAEESLRITKEWESTDATLDWEWEGKL